VKGGRRARGNNVFDFGLAWLGFSSSAIAAAGPDGRTKEEEKRRRQMVAVRSVKLLLPSSAGPLLLLHGVL